MFGDIKVDPVLRFPLGLDEVKRAFDLMHEGKSIRSVIIY